MCFAKKHNKKGLKMMQANNAKAVSARAEAIKPKMPKGPSHKPKGCRLCQLKPKVQTKAEAVATAKAQLQLQLRPSKVPRPL
jgi:large subunit ribosomal protein L29e